MPVRLNKGLAFFVILIFTPYQRSTYMNHQNEAQNEHFQRERIALFSDAVFAIAMTLLIIEIKVPELHGTEVSDRQLLNNLLQSIPKFIGFFISFFVIGLYWMAHHRLFRYVVRSNQKLLSSNLLFLLPIVIMPFSTAFLSEYYNVHLRVPAIVYTVNICLTGFGSYNLWKVVASPKYNLSEGLNKMVLAYNTTRALTIPILFIVLMLLSLINPWVAYVAMPLIPLTTGLIKRYYKKKYPELWQERHLE